MRRSSHSEQQALERGVVLPIALIMLVIISFAGLLAARNSASFDQFSNNMRTNQVARVSAEDALRRCERFARYSVDESATIPPEQLAQVSAATAKIITSEIDADDEAAMAAAQWNIRSNWAASNVTSLITVTPSYTGSNAQSSAQLRNAPTCIIQSLVNDRFLVTSRGLSNDAAVDSTSGMLTAGSEVWLQSILTPSVPTVNENGVPN